MRPTTRVCHAEELGASIVSRSLLTVAVGVAALERTPMEMTVYRATLDREPQPMGEIAALAWFSPDAPFAEVVAPAVAESVVPALVAAGAFSAG